MVFKSIHQIKRELALMAVQDAENNFTAAADLLEVNWRTLADWLPPEMVASARQRKNRRPP